MSNVKTDDIRIAEKNIIKSVEYLRLDPRNTTPASRNKYRRVITGEMAFLRNNSPQNPVLSFDLTDIDFELEKIEKGKKT